MSITLPSLPYDIHALEPHVSARTLEFHHGKHHKAYVDKLNKAIENSVYQGLALEAIIARSHGTTHTNVYNNAAQAWNHGFLWRSMSPSGGGRPTGRLKAELERSFGDYDHFAASFKAAAAGQFGSGWAWLVWDNGNVQVRTTSNADTPLVMDQQPLLTLDVWEHAYYLDYQNDRGAYIEVFLQHLVNWEFANTNLEAAASAS
jgi:Fe-Mn family superoxide dismutase